MPDIYRTGIFFLGGGGWSENLSNFLGLVVEAGASPMYPQKMRVPSPHLGLLPCFVCMVIGSMWCCGVSTDRARQSSE